jgi:quercetin dioxygenase-like cupin family protein
MFLGVRVDILTGAGAPVVVAEARLPAGASPPLHVHDELDDSFYVLDGRMVVRCGDDVFLASAGTWVQFPSRVPHTFRVLDAPARVLLVHADDSFIRTVKAVGRPADADDTPTTRGGPSVRALDVALARHGITNVGPPMEQDEADRWLDRVDLEARR